MARPTLGDSDTQRLHIKITEAEIEAIDDWRFANRVPSRSEAVRRLCQIGLDFHHFAETYGKRAYELADVVHDKQEGDAPLSQSEYSLLFNLLIYTAVSSGRALRYGGKEALEGLLKNDARLKMLIDQDEEDEQ